MPSAHPRPELLLALASSVGEAARRASALGEDLLDEPAIIGDLATQRAVDAAVEEAAGLLRLVAVEGEGLALVLGSLGSRGRRQGSEPGVGPSPLRRTAAGGQARW